ncbi:MAG TPA: 3-ketoacyl-ACP reductase, partial [Balneolaceae bacterium]|nr:3-ketoacyl-ACP reductase [Balneolaceae bacterium]
MLGQNMGWGQVINGQVIDRETEEALPYVNIGVVELGIGTVSNRQGVFSLE